MIFSCDAERELLEVLHTLSDDDVRYLIDYAHEKYDTPEEKQKYFAEREKQQAGGNT